MSKYAVVVGDRSYEVSVHETGRNLSIEIGGEEHTMGIDPWLGTTHFRMSVDGTPHTAVIRRRGETFLVTLGEEQYRLQVTRSLPIARRGAGTGATVKTLDVTAPMPGVIVSVEVAAGDRIEQGRPVAVMEAMKMQSEIPAPMTGRVASVQVRPGQEVVGGTALATIIAETTG